MNNKKQPLSAQSAPITAFRIITSVLSKKRVVVRVVTSGQHHRTRCLKAFQDYLNMLPWHTINTFIIFFIALQISSKPYFINVLWLTISKTILHKSSKIVINLRQKRVVKRVVKTALKSSIIALFCFHDLLHFV